MTRRSMTTVAAAVVLGIGIGAPSALAGRGNEPSVSACSRYGNGCISAPVRKGRFGPEMRLKGGTWIDCRSNCKDTLREETIDFWETQRERNGGRSR